MFGSRKIKTRPYDCRQYHYGHLTRKEALEEYPESGISPTDIDGDSAFAVTWSGDALGLIAGYREYGIWINFINPHTGTIDDGAPIWMRMKGSLYAFDDDPRELVHHFKYANWDSFKEQMKVLGIPSWKGKAQATIRLRYLIQI